MGRKVRIDFFQGLHGHTEKMMDKLKNTVTLPILLSTEKQVEILQVYFWGRKTVTSKRNIVFTSFLTIEDVVRGKKLVSLTSDIILLFFAQNLSSNQLI